MENSYGSSGFNSLMQINQSIQTNDTYSSSFPPGYRFLPTDAELLVHYLAKKIYDQPLQPNGIVDIELYKFHPEELPKKGDDSRERYFFTPRDRKYRNGSRPSRSASTGYWKATGKDKVVVTDDNVRVGYKKSLVFFEGKPPGGVKTKWLMHEYKLDNLPERQRAGPHDMRLDDWVLCKVYQKENKKRPEDEYDDEVVEESIDEGNFLRSKKRKEREEANSESPETTMPQNSCNYGDAGCVMPPPPLEQVYVHGQNINIDNDHSHGDVGGELHAPFEQTHVHGPCKAFSYLGEILFPVEQDEDEGVLLAPFQQVHVHSPCTTFKYQGEILFPIEKDDEDNGQDQNELISNGGGFDFSNGGQGLETLDRGEFHSSNGSEGPEALYWGNFDSSNGGQGLEAPQGGDFNLSNGGQGLTSNGSNGGQMLGEDENEGMLIAPFQQVHVHSLSTTFNYRVENLIPIKEDDEDNVQDQNELILNGDQGLEEDEDDIVLLAPFQQVHMHSPITTFNYPGEILIPIEEDDEDNGQDQNELISNGGQGLETPNGGGFDYSNGGQGLEALNGVDFNLSNGSERLDEGESDHDLGLDILDFTKWAGFYFKGYFKDHKHLIGKF